MRTFGIAAAWAVVASMSAGCGQSETEQLRHKLNEASALNEQLQQQHEADTRRIAEMTAEKAARNLAATEAEREGARHVALQIKAEEQRLNIPKGLPPAGEYPNYSYRMAGDGSMLLFYQVPCGQSSLSAKYPLQGAVAYGGSNGKTVPPKYFCFSLDDSQKVASVSEELDGSTKIQMQSLTSAGPIPRHVWLQLLQRADGAR